MGLGRLILWCAAAGVLAASVVSGVGGCDAKGGKRAAGPLRVVVTIPPLAGLAQPLLPKDAELKTLMAPGRSEHGYEFTAEDLATLGRADVVVLVGMMLEPKVEQFLKEHPSAGRQVVNFAASAGLAGPDDAEHKESGKDDHKGHAHGDGHEGHDHDEHDHAAGDPHLWLDPIFVSQLVPAMRSAVQTALKAQGIDDSARLESAEREVLAQVLRVDDEYRAGLAPHQGKGIVTHHAAWGRLADRYGLKVAEVLRPVESVEPDASHTAKVVEALKVAGAKAIFIEPAYDRRSAERIAEAAGARVVTMDPLGSGDWFAMMRGNLKTLVEAFGSASGPAPAPAPAPQPQ